MSRMVPRQVLKLALACLFFPLGALASAPGVMLNAAHPNVRAVAAVQAEVTENWMRQPEVLGTAVTLDSSGATALAVYVDRDSPKAVEVVRSLPDPIQGIGVQIRLTEKFRAMRHRHRRHHRRHHRGGSIATVGHKFFQTPPIQLGTSGGWSRDRTGNRCGYSTRVN